MSIYHDELGSLAEVLRDPRFGRQAPTMGAELEMVLVDRIGRPARCNQEILAALHDPLFVPELMSHQLEYNARPRPLAGQPFTKLGAELQSALARVKQSSPPGVEPALIGILPTLTANDLTPQHITDKPRYHDLDNAMRHLYGPTYRLEIGSLQLPFDSLSLQGANTSFQTHLSVKPEDFACTYNATQLAAALVMALSSNSPCLLGHYPAQEARISVFRQAARGRAPFGRGWIRDAPDLFGQVVDHYEPLLPPAAAIEDQPFPALKNLRRLNSSVWFWNRPVYDPAGNLRIESRYLPSGPTMADMMANAAFLIGLTLGLRDRMAPIVASFDFAAAKHNFYEAATDGLAAELRWPGRSEVSTARLILDHLELAHDGLVGADVDATEATNLLSIIEERAKTGTTGATWQLSRLRSNMLDGGVPKPYATEAMFERYQQYSSLGAGEPVHTWLLPS